jgi:hypothetical protein
MPILNALTAAGSCSVLSIVDAVTGIGSLLTISMWALFAIRHFMHFADILPKSVGCSFTKVDPTLVESMIHCPLVLVYVNVPKMVSNLFMLESFKSMLDIAKIPFMNPLPIN